MLIHIIASPMDQWGIRYRGGLFDSLGLVNWPLTSIPQVKLINPSTGLCIWRSCVARKEDAERKAGNNKDNNDRE